MATPVQFANGPLPQAQNATLTSSIAASGAVTPTVDAATYLPTLGPFAIVVDNERLLVDSISGTTLTIPASGRGTEGTTAAAHSSGAAVYQVITTGTLQRHIDERLSLRSKMALFDDFAGGIAEDGKVGTLGWRYTTVGATGTLSAVATTGSGHPGMIRMDPTNTSGTRMYLWLGASSTVGLFIPADGFTATFMVRLNTSDTNTTCRFGLATDANADPPATGIFIEKLLADTSWFGVCRSASTQTRTAGLETTTTAEWIKGEIRRVDASTIGFRVSTTWGPDAGTEEFVTTNIPTAALLPFCMVGMTGTGTKTLDLDYVEIGISDLAR